MSSIMAKQKKKRPLINRQWCKGCGICVEFCPEDALTLDAMEKAALAYPDRCNGCGMCELRCPDLAIELE
jgi:2-oxoglutarate ferredoxin oxidoreductase subunit delta